MLICNLSKAKALKMQNQMCLPFHQTKLRSISLLELKEGLRFYKMILGAEVEKEGTGSRKVDRID